MTDVTGARNINVLQENRHTCVAAITAHTRFQFRESVNMLEG